MSEGKYAYELEGWLEGKKIRRRTWYPNSFIYFDKDERYWKDENLESLMSDSLIFSTMFIQNDWEYFKEPKKITLYRYTLMTRPSKRIYQTTWQDKIEPNCIGSEGYDIIKTETKEIEIEAQDE